MTTTHIALPDLSADFRGREDITVKLGEVQYQDGIVRHVLVGPLHPDMPLTVAEAREIGEALIAAADEGHGN